MPYTIVFADNAEQITGPTDDIDSLLASTRFTHLDVARRIVARSGETDEYVWDHVRKGWVNLSRPYEPLR